LFVGGEWTSKVQSGMTPGWSMKWGTAVSSKFNPAVTTMGIDIGKNSFHISALMTVARERAASEVVPRAA
jgi:hypothetical protein